MTKLDLIVKHIQKQNNIIKLQGDRITQLETELDFLINMKLTKEKDIMKKDLRKNCDY